MKLILATNNKNKLREVRQILEPLGYEVISQSEAGINIEVEETGETFEQNAELKAQAIYERTKTEVIADDSGLEVDALGGQPGVYSARYGGEGLSDSQRVSLLIDNMKDVDAENRTARFVCVLCYISSDGTKRFFKGTCEGKIGFEPKGENGFGYDPVFMVGEKSMSELSSDEKNQISHRGNALKKLEVFLSSKQKGL